MTRHGVAFLPACVSDRPELSRSLRLQKRKAALSLPQAHCWRGLSAQQSGFDVCAEAQRIPAASSRRAQCACTCWRSGEPTGVCLSSSRRPSFRPPPSPRRALESLLTFHTPPSPRLCPCGSINEQEWLLCDCIGGLNTNEQRSDSSNQPQQPSCSGYSNWLILHSYELYRMKRSHLAFGF